MSKTLTEQTQVYTFLQKALDRQREQGSIMQVMLDQMRQIESNVKRVEENIEQRFSEVSELVQEVRDSVTLTDAECYELQSLVYALSVELAKTYFNGEDASKEEFSAQVGKFRRGIWKKVKERFEVAKYSHIRRVDFQEAVSFVNTITIKDFVTA